ncbi:farnesyl pyrophosphate synthase-like, partial [Chiloscyllium plagiosum]|uniref:farnesyl pyrophosphate synthase-like n=1 Tax=Chiloscyllium plagiosum TaxID=36176 RepID=UPI001CB7EB7D
MEYNVPGGKRNRGLSVLASFRALAGPMLQTQENIHRVLIVGWCVELLQAFFLVADDIMDQSITRRGRVCWYRKVGIVSLTVQSSQSLDQNIVPTGPNISRTGRGSVS